MAFFRPLATSVANGMVLHLRTFLIMAQLTPSPPDFSSHYYSQIFSYRPDTDIFIPASQSALSISGGYCGFSEKNMIFFLWWGAKPAMTQIPISVHFGLSLLARQRFSLGNIDSSLT